MAVTDAKRISGWKWADIDAFNVALATLNAGLGIPVSPSSTTQTAMIEQSNTYNEEFFYYTGYNAQFEHYLGAPSNFFITIVLPDTVPAS